MTKVFILPLLAALQACAAPVTPEQMKTAERLCADYGGLVNAQGASPWKTLSVWCKDGTKIEVVGPK